MTVFEVEDRDGNAVVLDENVWHNHILRRHPEIGDYLPEMQEVIKNPGIITRHAGSVHYSRLGAIQNRPHLYLEVVVKEDGFPPTGTVRTAFLKRTSPKGDLLWMSKS